MTRREMLAKQIGDIVGTERASIERLVETPCNVFRSVEPDEIEEFRDLPAQRAAVVGDTA
jgi:hypothetical protein